MQREIIRVEPIDSNFEKWGVPVSTCTSAGNRRLGRRRLRK
jgi:2-iminobutanoate/2-iminopropanoate deaminase